MLLCCLAIYSEYGYDVSIGNVPVDVVNCAVFTFSFRLLHYSFSFTSFSFTSHDQLKMK